MRRLRIHCSGSAPYKTDTDTRRMGPETGMVQSGSGVHQVPQQTAQPLGQKPKADKNITHKRSFQRAHERHGSSRAHPLFRLPLLSTRLLGGTPLPKPGGTSKNTSPFHTNGCMGGLCGTNSPIGYFFGADERLNKIARSPWASSIYIRAHHAKNGAKNSINSR